MRRPFFFVIIYSICSMYENFFYYLGDLEQLCYDGRGWL